VQAEGEHSAGPLLSQLLFGASLVVVLFVLQFIVAKRIQANQYEYHKFTTYDDDNLRTQYIKDQEHSQKVNLP